MLAELDERERLLENERDHVTAGREELSRAVANVSSGLRLPGEATGAPLDPDGHLLYVATADGYRIVECDGSAPGLHTQVEHDGRSFVVARVGRSPLPGDRRACVYVEATTHP